MTDKNSVLALIDYQPSMFRGVASGDKTIIRSSWGTGWGPNGGYLWLPYDYVLKWQAVDWWSLLKNEWIWTGNFGL